jgi:ATP-dependent Clp protease, protease subunit
MAVESPLRVPYNLPGSQQWQWINIFTRMSQERIIFLNQTMTMGLANSLIASMLYLDSQDSGKPIFLYINSYGDPVATGDVNEGAGFMSVAATLSIYDTMQHIKSEIHTICLGQAVGLAALILSAGTKGKRASLPHSMIALSQPYSGVQGQATDIQVNAQEVGAKRRLMLEVFAKNTGQAAEKIDHDMQRIFYLSPTEAVEYGLIDRVITSSKS